MHDFQTLFVPKCTSDTSTTNDCQTSAELYTFQNSTVYEVTAVKSQRTRDPIVRYGSRVRGTVYFNVRSQPAVSSFGLLGRRRAFDTAFRRHGVIYNILRSDWWSSDRFHDHYLIDTVKHAHVTSGYQNFEKIQISHRVLDNGQRGFAERLILCFIHRFCCTTIMLCMKTDRSKSLSNRWTQAAANNAYTRVSGIPRLQTIGCRLLPR